MTVNSNSLPDLRCTYRDGGKRVSGRTPARQAASRALLPSGLALSRLLLATVLLSWSTLTVAQERFFGGAQGASGFVQPEHSGKQTWNPWGQLDLKQIPEGEPRFPERQRQSYQPQAHPQFPPPQSYRQPYQGYQPPGYLNPYHSGVAPFSPMAPYGEYPGIPGPSLPGYGGLPGGGMMPWPLPW